MASESTYKGILGQVQDATVSALNSDAVLSGKVTFVSENAKDIDFQIKDALGRQGIVGIVMTPEATYQGSFQGEELAWELNDFTVQVVENPMVNRGQADATKVITALDAAQRASDVLASPSGSLYGTYCPTTTEQGEDGGLLVAQSKFKALIRALRTPVFPSTQGAKMSDGTFIPLTDSILSQNLQSFNLVLGAVTPYSAADIVELAFYSNVNLYAGTSAFNKLKRAYVDSSCQRITSQYLFASNTVEEVVFKGRTYAQIAQMQNYPWGISDVNKIVALDDTIMPTKVKYTAASGLPDLEIDLIGQLSADSIPDISSVQSVEVGNRVYGIRDFAFTQCSSLTNVTIPNSVTSIGSAAFDRCINLTSIEIPDSVTEIGNEAFWNCTGLESVTIPDSIDSIGRATFYGCSSLTSVTIPDSVTDIGNGAFEQCSSLQSVTIGNSVESIGEAAFADCIGLASIAIPNSVTSIGNYAFEGSRGLANVTIGDNVTSIGTYVFGECRGLASVTFNSFTKGEVKSMTTDRFLFGDAFYDEWNPIEKSFTAICTDGSMTVHFSADYPATISFTDL